MARPEIRDKLARLQSIPAISGKARVQAFSLWSGDQDWLCHNYLHELSCPRLRVYRLEAKKRRDGTPKVRRWWGDQEIGAWSTASVQDVECAHNLLLLPPGRYYLSYISRHASGNSRTFTCQAGVLIRVVVVILPHI